MVILTVTSESTRLVEYEWTINGVIYGDTSKSIDVDVESPDVVSVIAKNDCGGWSERVYLEWEPADDKDMIMIIILIIVIILSMRL